MTKFDCVNLMGEAVKMNYPGYSVTCELEESGRYFEVYPAHVIQSMEQTGDIDLEFGLDIADHEGDIVSNVMLESLVLQA